MIPKAFLNDLAELYVRLNHGDDDELLAIVRKHGYDITYVGGQYEVKKLELSAKYADSTGVFED